MAKSTGKAEKPSGTRSTVALLPPPSDAPTPPAADTPKLENESTIPRLGVPFDPKTGKIVFDGMRPSTKEKLRVLLDDDRLSRELGVNSATTPGATNAENDALAAVVVNVLYDAIGSLSVILAKSRGFGDHAELLRYSEEEKKQFAGPTMKVLGKYDLLGGKYADELLLLAAVGSVTTGHIMAMTHAANAARAVPLPGMVEKAS